MTSEEWRPVVGYEGLYEVSDQGRVRGLDRVLSDGRSWKGKTLKPSVSPQYGHLGVTLRKEGTSRQEGVHRLVCLAFNGPPPSEEYDNALHGDGEPSNNTPGNLRWGTKRDNARDSIRHGTRRNQYSGSTTCSKGHPWIPGNTYVAPGTGKRRCRECAFTPPPPEDPRHGKVTTYTTRGCRCRECKKTMREWRKNSEKVPLLGHGN